jgi:hypothetical protein
MTARPRSRTMRPAPMAQLGRRRWRLPCARSPSAQPGSPSSETRSQDEVHAVDLRQRRRRTGHMTTLEAPDIEGLLRQLGPQVLGALARRHGQFDDATQEALFAAARQWPKQGIPDHPRGWLLWENLQARTGKMYMESRSANMRVPALGSHRAGQHQPQRGAWREGLLGRLQHVAAVAGQRRAGRKPQGPRELEHSELGCSG